MNCKSKHHTYICVGRTGTGKSSICNRILGKNIFLVSDSGKSVTSAPELARSINLGYTFTVVDTPGVMDTSVNSNQAKKKSCDEMIQAMVQCPEEGKRALLLVLKYGDRFTEETRKCVDIIETIFGEECIEQSCIVVFTHGEAFDANNKERKVSFEDWCQSQGKSLGILLQRCKYRCLLFRNKISDLEIRRQQIERLIEMTNNRIESYTQEKFQVARKKHKRLILESKLPEMLKDLDIQLNKVQEKIFENLLQNEILQNFIPLKKEVNEIVLKFQFEDEGIYYNDGEKSLFFQPMSRVQQLVKLIRNQQFRKLEHELKSLVNQFQSKVMKCEDIGAMDLTESALKEGYSKCSDFGLAIEGKVTLNPDKNVLSLQSEDMQRFDNVNILIKELSISMKEKREALISKSEKDKLRKDIKLLERHLIEIPESETNSDKASLVIKEADKLLRKVKSKKKLKKWFERLVELKEDAAVKEEQCQNNKDYLVLDLALSVVLGGLGVFGQISKIGLHLIQLYKKRTSSHLVK